MGKGFLVSTVVSVIHHDEQYFGEVLYFCLSDPQPLALVNAFSLSNEQTLSNETDSNLITDPNLLNKTIVKVSCLNQELRAIPIQSLKAKCILVCCENANYVIELPNNIECH